MAMKIKNIGKKIIGIGDVTVLPGKTEEIPKTFERSPILEIYKKMGIAEISGKPASNKSNTQGKEADKKAAEKKAAEEAEALRQARLASLEGITEEALASLASELGINPADCKDQEDVLEKVKEALEK